MCTEGTGRCRKPCSDHRLEVRVLPADRQVQSLPGHKRHVGYEDSQIARSLPAEKHPSIRSTDVDPLNCSWRPLGRPLSASVHQRTPISPHQADIHPHPRSATEHSTRPEAPDCQTGTLRDFGPIRGTVTEVVEDVGFMVSERRRPQQEERHFYCGGAPE